MSNLPHVVVVTADTSRWLLDEEFVQQEFDSYWSDISRYADKPDTFTDCDWMIEETLYGSSERGTVWEHWLFPYARLVSAGGGLLELLHTGDLRTGTDPDEEYIIDHKYPYFEIATKDDLNPTW